MLRTLCLLVAVGVPGLASGQEVLPDPGRFQTTAPALRITGTAAAFEVRSPVLRLTARDDGFAAKTPTLRIAAQAHAFFARTPTLSIAGRADAFLARTPTLSIAGRTDTFRAATPRLRITGRSDAFRMTSPELRLTGADEAPENRTSAAGTAANLACGGLLQCFARDDILAQESSLRSIGTTPETQPAFCQWVQQSLGPCDGFAPGGTGAPATTAVPTMPWTPPGVPDTEGPVMARCIPLENHILDVQRRFDAGENTETDAIALNNAMRAAQHVMMTGRMDRWCDVIMSILGN